MSALTLQAMAPTSRVGRYPKHQFQMRVRPYQIAPFMIAPVLPAETLENIRLEAREVTDPIKSSIIGWSSEWFLFYVKIRDLNERDTLDDMFLDPTNSVLNSLDEASSTAYYHGGGTPNYTKLALRRVVECYFRDDGEAWNNADIGNYPSAQVRAQGWMDSLTDTTLLTAGAAPSGAADMESLDKLSDAYEYLRSMQLTDMSFEDYCQTFGIKLSREALHKPTLLANWKQWQYPSNTVEPSTGIPASAVSWVFKEMERKRFLFKEPGFIVGIHLVRPKVYFGRQYASLTHYMDTGMSWLPAILKDMPETSLREFTGGAAGNGPLSNGTVGPTNGYWVDMRDLFLYGDQFVNFALTETDGHLTATPTAGLTRKYLTSADVDAFFKSASPANQIRSDGYASFSIKGMQRDYTGGHQADY